MRRQGAAGKPPMLILGAMMRKLVCVWPMVFASPGGHSFPACIRWPDNSIYVDSSAKTRANAALQLTNINQNLRLR